jgi:hypothetical protein
VILTAVKARLRYNVQVHQHSSLLDIDTETRSAEDELEFTAMQNQPPPPDENNGSPAGWYSDPLGSSSLRYWDGAAWTTDIQAGGTTSSPGGGKRGGWWSANWRYVAFTAAGFLVGGVIGASGNSSKTTTVTNTSREVMTKTVPEVRTKTETVTAKAAPTEPAPVPSSSSGEGQAFSGNGGKNLGNVEVPTDSTLSWTNDGGIMQIFANETEVLLNSTGHSGDTFLPAGTYSSMQVNAVGNWTISIEAK